jgi:uncharacterized protein YcfJ
MNVVATEFTRYSDSAPVLRVEPIREQAFETVRHQVCEAVERNTPLLPLARSMGEDIRRQQRLGQKETHCRWVDTRQAIERVNGYRVTYRYGGRLYTQRMQKRPGERIPVTIALEPLDR